MTDQVTVISELAKFLFRGGPVLWIIAILSVITLAIILWKIWRLAVLGAWSGQASAKAVDAWCEGDVDKALTTVAGRRSLRAGLVQAAMSARLDASLSDAGAREETARVARTKLLTARSGLRAIELIATIAPLLGLFGTVLGMIEAFQALQVSGSQADPSILAGGIWQALLTTAAGMGVAIPASVALSWFESVIDRVQSDMEDTATRIFTRGNASKVAA